MSQGQKCWYLRKGLVQRNTHVKNENFSAQCSKVIGKVRVLKKGQLKDQGHKVKKCLYARKGLVTRIHTYFCNNQFF